MKKIIAILLLFVITYNLTAQDYEYKFRLTLKDKGETPYQLEKPEEFLSYKAIERRKRQHISINSSDLPISGNYIAAIKEVGGVIVATSKWLNTITVHCSDSAMIDQYKQLPFVSDAMFVWRGRPMKAKFFPPIILSDADIDSVYDNYYGEALDNIQLHSGEFLHQQGYKGEGLDIAVIDAGFNHLNDIELLNNINIKGYKGFVYGREDLFYHASQHGLNALSCIATNKPYQYIGTAPEASYWLFGTEDSSSEYPVEEDYWAAAIEYADSVGVDVVNTSLGYVKFHAPAKSVEYKDLDGNTTLISRAASMATQKGIFVVCSAGNSGASEWQRITPPADTKNVLTVGAIHRDSTITKFSSRGYTADLRVKPDVVALGANSIVIGDTGEIITKNGTSFSSPIMCGLVACLWQANPTLTNKELLDVIQRSSNKYNQPNEAYGYGIPNMKIAMQFAKELADKKK